MLEFIIAVVIFLVLSFAIPVILFFRFSKTKHPFGLARLLGGIHLFLVVLCGVFIYFGIKRDPEAVLIWLLFFGFDMPVSLLLYLIHIVDKAMGYPYSFMWRNFYIPFIFFALLGSAQYFFIGVAIGRLYKKLTKNKEIGARPH